MTRRRNAPALWAVVKAIWMFAGLTALLPAQPEWVVSAKGWTGTISASADHSETDLAGFKHTLSVRLSSTFTMAPAGEDSPYSFEGKHTQTAISMKYSGAGESGCPYVDTFEASGPTTEVDTGVHLTHFRDKWTFSGGIYRLRGNLTRTFNCPPPKGPSVLVYEDVQPTVVMSLAGLPYPSGGPSLRSTGTTEYPISFAVALYNVGKATPLQYTLTIESGGSDEEELEITSPTYLDWRPSAADDGNEGEPVEFTATLKTKSGETPRIKIDTLEWELLETSREPGHAINRPQKSTDRRPDLFFKEEFSMTGSMMRLPMDEEGQMVEVSFIGPGGLTDSIKVYPRDWGGWSTLRAVATLENGKKVTGRWTGASEDNLRLPDREKGRFIARSWLKQKGISDGDATDLDELPEGDGHKGDGLSLYEEYRGFYQDGARLEGNPKRKEYFAVNEAGATGRGGLALFQRITGLTVRGKLTRSEIDDDRVVNHNFSASPRVGPQHAVLIVNKSDYKGFAKAESIVNRPSTPKDIEFVGLPPVLPSNPTASPAVSYASSTVAHELLHTVNVYHHGEEDEAVFWSRDADGNLYEQKTEDQDGTEVAVGPKTKIRAFLESGEEVTTRVRLGRRELGHQNGQHSGWENCVMRYDVANTYVADTNANDRYVGIEEVPGAALCDTTEGIGVNAPGRRPQSRYGPSAAGRGTCKRQILVNDAVQPAAR